ncbi:flagellar basal-body rod protein FlgF [Pseudogulbenkiania sp. NH8B]|uniref:Flagellar basal-body rod protein FlgF n=1 Tax=Pseudogulbenkiania ferrooxidans 2002 TaxID=279714 RepID=B9Z360_9NEIS|nr:MULTISPECIES: flagellar basal-body rod protein FlgF [Pseudogulbenkiania]EEG09013.1 flagellar basal-body rod protein FlgF [Pseudogulbenkiania ferrooxidans 2002]BAK76354.1 flagellar basal-body rod protein FlgF [Pseudogulbenkiania sp. NH8B]
MDRMIYLAMTGAKHVMTQQATTSQNLANVHTNGYKADQVSFRALPVVGDGAPTRTYVVDNTIGHDLSQGSLQQTGNDTDFALGTPGFFTVQTADGREAYSRDGGFVADPNGMLRTRSGLPILGDGGPITVPTGSSVVIGPDGTVVTTPTSGADRTPQIAGQLKLVNPGERAVYKGEDGLFRLNAGGNATASDDVKVVSGALEGSNVNAVESLVQMISHARQFDLNVKLMQTSDQNEQKASQILALS